MTEPLLQATALRKSYVTPDGPLPVLDGVSLTVEAGAPTALTGESGSGKSTLLHVLAGLDTADAGAVHLAGTDVTALPEGKRAALRRQSVGLVFQQFSLIPSLNVAANIAVQAQLAGRHDPERQSEVAAALGIAGLLRRYPEELSGGQQQRVAIARALLAEPAVILADEPTGNLDEATSDRVVDVMVSLAADTGAALLMVTHSERLAQRLGQRLHLSRGRLT